MKIQIDTTRKTVRVEENVNLGEFIKMMSHIFPDFTWKEFTLEIGLLPDYGNFIKVDPIVIPATPFVPYTPGTGNPIIPQYPTTQPWIKYDSQSGGTLGLVSGVFMVDVKCQE